VWNDRARYRQYFEEIPGCYTAGDVATIDAEGFITVLGRADDVLSVAGHRIATADVESAVVSHPACGEAAVIGKPDEIKGEKIKAFVVLRNGHVASDDLRAAIVEHVRYHLGRSGRRPSSSSLRSFRRRVAARSCAASSRRKRQASSSET